MRRGTSLGALIVLAGAVVTTWPTGEAQACSCVGIGMAEAISQADVAFVGSTSTRFGQREQRQRYEWQFDVTDVIKGDVPASVAVVGQDWRSGCGTDYGSFTGSIVVLARREGDGFVDRGCSPVIRASELADALAPLPAPNGSGPVAAVVAYQYRWADVFALDVEGRVLSWGDLDGLPVAIAACPGSTRGVALIWADTRLDVRVVDLMTMQLIGDPLAEGIQPGADELVCIETSDPARPRVVLGGGGWRNDATAVFGVVEGGAEPVRRSLTGIADIEVGADGTVFAIPTDSAAPITRYTSPALDPAGQFVLEDGSGVAAALSEDRLAVLVDVDGQRGRHDTNATAIVIIDISGTVMSRVGGIELPAGGPGAAQQIEWLDDDTWAVTRHGFDTMWLDVIDTSGQLVSSTDIGWGFGAVVVDGRLLRIPDTGLQSIDRHGTVTRIEPLQRSRPFGGNPGYIDAVTDGPLIPALTPPPPHARPVTRSVAIDRRLCLVPVLAATACRR